jgi:hypothetical protein
MMWFDKHFCNILLIMAKLKGAREKINKDAKEAIAAARRGACSTAARHLDRARRLDLHINTTDQARPAGLIIRKLCKNNKEVKRVTWGSWLRG